VLTAQRVKSLDIIRVRCIDKSNSYRAVDFVFEGNAVTVGLRVTVYAREELLFPVLHFRQVTQCRYRLVGFVGLKLLDFNMLGILRP
jgi:hypothetical protein